MGCFAKDLLQDHHVAISGGLGDLGRAVVRGLTEHGARVSVNDILEDSVAAEALAREGVLAERVSYTRADLTRCSEVERFVAAARRKFGPITTTMCHAGIVLSNSLLDVSEDTWDHTMNVNLKSAFLFASESAKSMIEDGTQGHIIFTTSWVSEVPWPGIGAYNASKAGLNQLMRTFARELATRGIRANAIAPGIVAAGLAKRQWDTEPEYRIRAQKAIPLGRMQPLQSVVDAFLFLCSRAASYMTGSVLLVDGGCSLYPMD
jgi:NAD(P)-dependent dehydrogenase (short-subunit alcohol dehydrogenase family)